MPVTRRRSPAKPTSPITTTDEGRHRSANDDATANATAKSDDGSVSRMPPTVDR
jgi:hypothetical protein